jgi:hypothetical protein
LAWVSVRRTVLSVPPVSCWVFSRVSAQASIARACADCSFLQPPSFRSSPSSPVNGTGDLVGPSLQVTEFVLTVIATEQPLRVAMWYGTNGLATILGSVS